MTATAAGQERAMPDLWTLVWGKPAVDPADLAEAIARELDRGDPDFRTRLLIRDGTEALAAHWGEARLRKWLSRDPARSRIDAIRREDLGEPGFPALKGQLVEKTGPETVKQFLRDLGVHVARPARLRIGGAIALILPGYLERATQDIDVVDEVPEEIRSRRPLLRQLARRYGLHLTHFQSHDRPAGWEDRLRSWGSFGRLEVATVDAYDIAASKLFSSRVKDLDDLRLLDPVLDRDTLVRRLQATTAALRREPRLREAAETNWYILRGEGLPAQATVP
jgi:Nucleotidyltransferase of unknown function (DUF6036)